MPKNTLRNTKARQLITTIFASTPKPLSLEEVFQYAKLSLPKVAYSTIFRIVARLVQEGKVHQVDWRERGSRYEWTAFPHHHHITCQICGHVKDINDEVLKYDESRIQQKTGYLTKHHSIELEGICPQCQKKQKKN